MISFTRAPEIAVGDKIKSAQLSTLAAAFNDRMRSGVGDWTFRMWFKALNLVRVIRNPVPPAYSPKLDFFESFIHVPFGEGGWPATAAEAGFEGGANVVNPLMGFAHGVEALNVFNEIGRLEGGEDDATQLPVSFPTSAIGIWELGKLQRGVAFSDGETESSNAPALLAARAHRGLYTFAALSQPFDAGINFGVSTSAFLKKYGGVLPRPAATECPSTGRGTFVYGFTPLRAGVAAKSYTVPCTGPGVTAIRQMEDHYLVVFSSGETERLEKSDYIHGPFTADQQLEHRTGTMLDEAVGEYVASFGGTDAERATDDGYGIRDVAFDFQAFLERQYLLAPAQATLAGDTLTPDYPGFLLNYGEELMERTDGSGVNATCAAGFVLAGVLLTATDVMSANTISIRTGTDVHETVSVPAGTSERVIWFEVPKSCGVIECAPSTPIVSGSIVLELCFLQERKPEICDAYLLLRLAIGESKTGATASASGVAADYLATGCIRSATPLEAIDYASECPVVEAVRKQYRENLRLATRRQLRGYAVEDGKSVLWFTRHVNVGGTLFDAWDGIAPGLDAVASGALLGGVEYKVTGGSIEHNGVTVADGGTFTAALGVKTFTGPGEVRQVNGILANAPPNGLSNEWLMFPTFNCYNDSESSPFKPDGYGDVAVGLINRCHFYPIPPAGFPTDLELHVGSLASPEAASMLNYWHGTNEIGDCTDQNNGDDCRSLRARFQKSCQVYPPDYEIESAVMDGSEVKLTFKGRLRMAEGAPEGDIARESETHAALAAELWRSDENGVREYLLHARGGENCSVKIGDGGGGAYLSGVSGSCHPKFWFTRLMPKVFVETPDTEEQDALDTRAFSAPMRWMAWSLDAGCEGFIDPTVAAGGCPSVAPGTYTSEALFYQTASGVSSVVAYNAVTGEFDDSSGGTFTLQGRSAEDEEWAFIANVASPHPYTGLPFVRLLHTPVATPDRWMNTMTSAVRADKLQWFGPVPNSKCYAGTFNQLARAVNLLTSAFATVPLALERRSVSYNHTAPSADVTYGGTLPSCVSGATYPRPLIGAGLVKNPAMNIEAKSVLVLVTPWVRSDGGFTAAASGNIASMEVRGNSGATMWCNNGSPQLGQLANLYYDEIRTDPVVLASVISAQLLENVVPGDLAYTVSVTRRDVKLQFTTDTAFPIYECLNQFSTLQRVRTIVEEATTCERLSFADGFASTERYLRELSPTSNKQPVPVSATLGMFIDSSRECIIGPTSTVSVALNGWPYVILNFPIE